MKTIDERARDTAWKIWEDTDLSEHSVDRVSEIIAEKIIEQKAIDNAEWLKIKSSWEREAQINHNDENNYKQGFHDAIENACGILEYMTGGRLGKRFISEFKNKLKYGVLERH